MDDFLPSVFDRLTDPDMAARRGRYSLGEVERKVYRDLEELLNARRPPEGHFGGMEAVERSIVNFGLRDLSFANATSLEERASFAEHIRFTIELFDPRLKDVQVLPRDPSEVRDADGPAFKVGAIYLRIRATLNVDPYPVEGVVFDTVYETTSGRHKVAPGAGR